MSKDPIIGVVITSYGSIDPIAYHNHLSCLLSYAKKYQLIVYHVNGVQQPVALNMMTQQAIKDGCTHVLYLEHDNTMDKTYLDMLIADEKDLVSGWYTLRRYPFAPIPLLKDGEGTLDRMEFVYQEGQEYLLEVDVACFGFCLVRTSLLEEFDDDFFSHGYDSETKTFFTPDVILFNKVKEAGRKIYVDGRVKVGHLGDSLVVTPDNWRLVNAFYQQAYPQSISDKE